MNVPVPGGERLATLERGMHDVELELNEIKSELVRTRGRLHDMEGLVGVLVSAQKESRRAEDNQYRRLELKVQWLTVAIALAGLMLSAAVFATHH